MTQRKRTPRKVTPVKNRPVQELDDPLIDLPQEADRPTLTNPVELEQARAKSKLTSAPPGRVTAPPPPDAFDAMARERAGDPLVDMRDRYSLGDYTGALQIAERILAEDAAHAEALKCAESCRDVLVKMYAARLGPMSRVPTVVIARNKLRWLSLDHRAGFVLSHVDGVSSLEQILDVSGMAQLDCLRILHELFERHVIAFR